ncbi:MAG: hypothetical protein VYD90_01230 [Pseudomonadota bacterium]|nr:hypothetical protein [Pseudomonadota bacterium]
MSATRRLLALSVLSAALLATPPLGARDRRMPGGRPGAGTANPSALVAAEIALNRRAREKGRYEAMRKFAADEAVLFAPTPVLAEDWLRGQEEPADGLKWDPAEIWMSCDGTLGLTQGGWTRADGSFGAYATIWKKREKKSEYRWVLSLRLPSDEPVTVPDFLTGKVTDCPAPQPWNGPRKKAEDEIKVTADGPPTQGRSDDGTLRWRYATAPSGKTVLTVSLLTGGGLKQFAFEAGARTGDTRP